MQYNSPNENVKTHLKEVIYNAYYFKNGKKKKNAKILCFWVTNEPILSRLKRETKDKICYTEMKSSIVKIFCSITHLSSSARC